MKQFLAMRDGCICLHLQFETFCYICFLLYLFVFVVFVVVVVVVVVVKLQLKPRYFMTSGSPT